MISTISKQITQLSMSERGAYVALLAYLLEDRKPLPDDLLSLSRIAGAVSPQDHQAVSRVLALCFDQHPDGYWHPLATQAEDLSRKRSRAGSKGAQTRWKPQPKPQARVPDETPYEAIRALWVEMLPGLPRPHAVEYWTPARKAKVRARWKNELPDMDSWREAFELVQQSKFLRGEVQSSGRRPFRCDLFWLIKPENLLKLFEGKYS